MKENVFEGNQNQCYGCGACSQICPKDSIKMVSNVEGFLYPKIDMNTCIECNLCQKVCPVIEENLLKVLNPLSTKVYAAWNNNLTQIMESTSAAIFPLLAEAVLSKGGKVYGCAWDEFEIRAIHVRITKQKEVIRLKGSKYVQSSIGDTFKQVKSDLKSGNLVLFSGTPCQISGLKLFLKFDYDNLYLVDLVCHGVPSPKMLAAYVSYIEDSEKSRINTLKFRDKKKSGYRSYISWINSKTNIKTMHIGGLESYLNGFYNEYFNRESCYMCKFSSSNRSGDITLSDFWGIEKFVPELNIKRKYGLNMVMCNTIKGTDLFSQIKTNITLVNSKLEYAQKGDKRLVKNGTRPDLRDQIYKDLNEKSYAFIARTYLKPNFYLIRRSIPSWVKNFILKIKMLKSLNYE